MAADISWEGVMTIEDIILDHDKRGVAHLRPFLAADFCDDAARLIANTPGPVAIVTGFYIMGAELPETDGPPGALAMGRALQAMGREVVYVTDQVTLSVMQGLAGEEAEGGGLPHRRRPGQQGVRLPTAATSQSWRDHLH